MARPELHDDSTEVRKIPDFGSLATHRSDCSSDSPVVSTCGPNSNRSESGGSSDRSARDCPENTRHHDEREEEDDSLAAPAVLPQVPRLELSGASARRPKANGSKVAHEEGLGSLPHFLGHLPLVVKNTFLDTPLDRSGSLEEFLQERNVCSCPATRNPTVDTPRLMPTQRQQSTECEEVSALERALQLVVKNTFLNGSVDRSASLDEFLKERQTHSAPATRQHTLETPRMTTPRMMPPPSIQEEEQTIQEEEQASEVAEAGLGARLVADLAALTSGHVGHTADVPPTPVSNRLAWLRQVGSDVVGALSAANEWYPSALAPTNSTPPYAGSTAAMSYVPGPLAGYAGNRLEGIPEAGSRLECISEAGFRVAGIPEAGSRQPFVQDPRCPEHVADGFGPGFGGIMEPGPRPSPSRQPMPVQVPPPPQAPPPMALMDGDQPMEFDFDAFNEPETEVPHPEAEVNGLPSLGSVGHHEGKCQPCMFLHADGCRQMEKCTFCHLCPPGEQKRRRWKKLHEQKKRRRQEQHARRLEAEMSAFADFPTEDAQEKEELGLFKEEL